MVMTEEQIQKLVRDSYLAVREAIERSHLHRAWELLQEHDAEGNAKGTLPYTDEALVEFEAAYTYDPDDVGIVHHLAIAHHARAWDFKLQDDSRATREWEQALGYWRIIAASGEFWANLKAKFCKCAPEADSSWLDEVRHNLLENLLDIHVDFIRHYCESGISERATNHVEIVSRARIPPAVKKRLIGKVFEVMTSPVGEAKAIQSYSPGLAAVERFLLLFPDYLLALRMHAEICKAWVSGLSYRDQWDDIICLGKRAEPYANRLAKHPELNDEPLAKVALEELTVEFAQRGCDRGRSYSTVTERDAARDASEFGIKWCRLCYQYSPNSLQMRDIFSHCLNNHALSLGEEAIEVIESGIDPTTELSAAIKLYRLAVADLEEALNLTPDDEVIAKNLDIFHNELSTLELQRSLYMEDLL